MNKDERIVKITRIKKPVTLPEKDKINLEDIMMNNICKDLERDMPANNDHFVGSLAANKTKLKKVNDGDLLLSMTKRLNLVEKELKDNKLLFRELSISNQNIKRENEKLKITSNSEKENNILKDKSECKKCAKLNIHIKELNDYITELREFIKDEGYVLMTVPPIMNYSNEENERLEYLNTQIKNISKELNLEEEEYEEDEELNQIQRKIPNEIDINVLSKRIEEMNMLIYKDGNSKFEMDSDKIFKLKQSKELKIYFYKNGIIIESFKFYLFQSLEAKRILHDILDGFTPYVMQKQFPDGAVLNVVNNLNKEYNPTDQGNNLKSVMEPKVKNDKMTGEEFLNKFPEKVIRGGKIYNIREDMEQFVVVKKDNEYNLDQDEHYVNCENHTLSDDKLCKLKIKLIIIDKIITVNIPKEETFKILFDYIIKLVNSYSASGKNNKLLIDNKNIDLYVLYTTYPFKIYSYLEKDNLDSNGLFPSHFLILDEKKNLASK